MTIQAGQNLLHYRVVDKLGEGGMGEVWRAVDTSLDREVAIKVLPVAVAADTDRLARFEREAKLLASLNHPHIAAVFGLHEQPSDTMGQLAPGSSGQAGTRFIAMELVEGEDLAERLARGPLSVDETLEIGRQIAEALAVAHERGVIHRDLKPANIRLTADGKAKVLDFGLAKAVEPGAASGSAAPSMSPTATSLGTAAGVILGTAAYMSPEQARGRPADRRADLWSFGVVLYECLTGKELFQGETVSDSLAAILRKEPDWSALPTTTPPMIRLLIRRCLNRDPQKRLQDAGDARLELEQAIEDPRGESLGFTVDAQSHVETRGKTGWLPWGIAALFALFAAFLLLRPDTATPAEVSSLRLTVPVPGVTAFGEEASAPPTISPDGTHVVMGVEEPNSEDRLWLRPLESFTGRALDGTERAHFPFWSTDGRHLGFFQDGRIRRIELATGRVQAVGAVEVSSSSPRGGSWNDRGQILFVPNSNTGVHVVEASGEFLRQITTPDPEVPDCSHRWPVFLPDGDHFLFVLWTNNLEAREQHGGIYVASLSGEEPVRLVTDASSVAYAPPGYLLLMRGDNLIAIPFDADQRRLTGEAVVVTTGIMRNQATGYSAFSASAEGTLVYGVGQASVPSAMNWFDRNGVAVPIGIEPQPFIGARLSPDGNRAVAGIPGAAGDPDLWVIDLVRGVRTRLTQGPWSFGNAAWSADGTRLLFTSQEQGGLDFYIRRADGSGATESVLVDGKDKILFDWSRDGKQVVYWSQGSGSSTTDLTIYSVDKQSAEILIKGEPVYTDARFSPDGLWMTYASDESGRAEVYVHALGGDDGVAGGGRWQLSTAGGQSPHWRDDGREIVYVDPDRRVMAVDVELGQDGVTLGRPRELFTVEEIVVSFDATGDHDRFLLATRSQDVSEPVHVILNWRAGL